jgi:Ca2+-binding EF-hand superfamily protein
MVMSSTPSQRLNLAFAIMDTDGDGRITRAEMKTFLATMYKFSNKPRSADFIAKQTEIFFDGVHHMHPLHITHDGR